MKLQNWELAGFIWTVVLGSLLHFTYEWSGRNGVVGLFSAVNESTWEHLKLLFWPAAVFAAVEFLVFGRNIPGFVPIKAASILLGMLVIVALFYTYTGIVGRNFLAADIATFVIGAAAAFRFSYRQLNNPTGWLSSPAASLPGWIAAALLVFAFLVFTDVPPHIQLFRDPVSGKFGRITKP